MRLFLQGFFTTCILSLVWDYFLWSRDLVNPSYDLNNLCFKNKCEYAGVELHAVLHFIITSNYTVLCISSSYNLMCKYTLFYAVCYSSECIVHFFTLHGFVYNIGISIWNILQVFIIRFCSVLFENFLLCGIKHSCSQFYCEMITLKTVCRQNLAMAKYQVFFLWQCGLMKMLNKIVSSLLK